MAKLADYITSAKAYTLKAHEAWANPKLMCGFGSIVMQGGQMTVTQADRKSPPGS